MSDADQYLDRIRELAEELKAISVGSPAEHHRIVREALIEAAGLLETQGWPETAAMLREIAQ